MNSAACELCHRPFERPDRAQVRRSLARHLMQHHAHNQQAAVDRAARLVPRRPQ